MALLRHELSYRETNAYSITVCHCERFLKALHGATLVSDGAQGLSGGYQDLALFCFHTVSRAWRLLSMFLCQFDVSVCFFRVLKVRKRPCKQCLESGVNRR